MFATRQKNLREEENEAREGGTGALRWEKMGNEKDGLERSGRNYALHEKSRGLKNKKAVYFILPGEGTGRTKDIANGVPWDTTCERSGDVSSWKGSDGGDDCREEE